VEPLTDNAAQLLSGPLTTTQVVQEYIRLTKPRIALLIVISTAVGYCYGVRSSFSFLTFAHVLLGTTLLAAGAATLNQWMEARWDATMQRTKARPIPAGTISSRHAGLFGIVVTIIGTAELLAFCNPLSAVLGLLTSVLYLFAYTPLKRLHPICTTVGAIPGAMPPLIGFAAASGHLGIQAWVLFSILFLWQFPHFHAIAWIYREDYQRAGVKMLAVARPFGAGLTIEILSALLLLIPVTLAPALLHMAGRAYFIAALMLDLVFFYFGLQLALERTRKRARGLLLASVLYIPVLFAFLVFNSSIYSV
jgi:heme o synthase